MYDAEALSEAVLQFGPDMVMHQRTDLPDDVTMIAGPRTMTILEAPSGIVELVE